MDGVDGPRADRPKRRVFTTEYKMAIVAVYGGFSFWLDIEHNQVQLVTESWCRVVGGSGQRHIVTADGARLVDEGFV